ncbi:MAG: MaoC/PaaZ C-terminal domain-containing protein [Planctomycetota bacterium]|nr:MaoC/PaaZ C-terminal domain-containing protein [Planctomycetota bacterium]
MNSKRVSIPSLPQGLFSQRETLYETVRAVVKSSIAGKDPRSFRANNHKPLSFGPLSPASDHVRSFIQATRGSVRSFETNDGLLLPPTYAATWGMRLFSRLLAESGLRLPLARVLHVGNAVSFKKWPHADQELLVNARLTSVDVTESRSIVVGEMIHTDKNNDELFTVTMTMFFPGNGKKSNGSKAPRPPAPRVPFGATCLGRFHPTLPAIRNYSAVSGDFNPVHMSHLAAKASGFPRAFIHGYATKAYAANMIIQELLRGDPTELKSLDLQFKKPLFTGTDVGVYISPMLESDQANAQRIDIGPGPGESSLVTGNFSRFTGDN